MARTTCSAARRCRPHSTSSRTLALSSVASTVALLLNGPAGAQQQPASDLEEVTVTGSRIQRTTGFSTPVPVTAVTPEELTSFLPGSTIADQLDQLPQFYLTQSAQRGGGALFGGAGRSALDMRAMGPQRTLVLLDGARVTPADRDGSVHVDNFPTALLQQVEVVTGGASAAYGADALAGVTNFILNRDYTGFDVSVGAGRTDAGFGDQHNLEVAYGTELGDRWHFIGSIENQQIDPIDPEPHELGDWFRRWADVANPNYTGDDAAAPQRVVLPDVHSTRHTPTGRISNAVDAAGDPVAGFTYDGYNFTYDGSAVQPFRAGDVVGGATSNQSGGPEAYIADRAFTGGPYGAEVQRRNVFTGLTFDATDRTRFFMNLFAGETESNDHDQRGIPHLTFPWNGNIFVTNPFLPDAVREAMITQGVDSFRLEKQGQVFGQAGNYGDSEDRHNQFDMWTLQLGIDHQLNDNWDLQARIQRGGSDRYTTVFNEIRVDRHFLAMDTVSVDPDTGELLGDELGEDPSAGVLMCNVQRFDPTPAELQAAVDGYVVPAPQGDASLGGPEDLVPIPGPIGPEPTIRNCTPLNVLGQGNASIEAQNYVVDQKEGFGAVTQEFAEILLTGDIWEGFGPGPFGMAVGATYRDQWFWQYGAPVALMAYGPPRNAPALGIRGLPGGFEGGSANLHEFSTVPVISGGYDVWEVFTEFNLPLWESGPRRFELDLAARHSDYSTSGGIVSHKTGLNWQATESLRLRATASRDVREPTFAERFNLQGGGGSIDDPEFGGQEFEITVTSGGNPDLDPEEADTVTAGFVFQPANMQSFQLSVDWYEIDLTGAVGQLGQQAIVDQCFDGAQNLCELITRDPGSGEVTNVRNVFLNIDQAKVRGIDYEVLFNTEPDLFAPGESLSLRFLAGRLLEDSTMVAGGTPDDNAGQYTQPDVKMIATVRYNVGDFGINLQQRYIPESTWNNDWVEWYPGISVPDGTITVDDNTIQSKSYTDLTLLYRGDVAGGQSWQLSFAITNLFDVDPPVVPGFSQRFSAQSFGSAPNNFDVYGRRYMANFRYQF